MSRLYLGRLPYNARERDIERFLEGYGKIVNIALKYGFAFVDLEDARDADDAVHDLNGRSLDGMRVIVEVAKGRPRGSDAYRHGDRSRSRDRKRRSRSRSRDRRRRTRSRSRSRDRRRSRRSMSRSRSRSKSPIREKKRRSPSDSRSRSRSPKEIN